MRKRRLRRQYDAIVCRTSRHVQDDPAAGEAGPRPRTSSAVPPTFSARVAHSWALGVTQDVASREVVIDMSVVPAARSRVISRLAAFVMTATSVVVVLGLGPAGAGSLIPTASASSPRHPRCTIIGTPRPDRLVGTPRRDVICGGRGDDVILGRGGNDLLIGGPGRDDLGGGAGRDQLVGKDGADHLDGGSGNDTEVGGNGADTLFGRAGRDDLAGGAGADRITGEVGNDRISGGAGNDSGSGGSGNDAVAGGEGNDQLTGDAGADRVSGDAGNDTQSGGGGNDLLSGAGGDDELSGGAGGDDVDGGSGFNVCDAPSAANDRQVRCVVDGAAPVVVSVLPAPTTVDVSAAARLIVIRAHVSDDTGVKSVQISNVASLVSGTRRDGVWETTIRVPRYIAPGPRDIDIHVTDRVGRSTHETISHAYTVLDTVVDRQMPVLQSLRLSTSAVDVRSASKPITATVRVTDDLAGATELYLCAAHAFANGSPAFRQAGACASMEQVSGTRTDSTWRATYVVPKGAPSGTWNLEVWISDAAGNAANDFWSGPDELAAIGPTNEPRYKAIPGGAGVFSVVGTPQDLHEPVLTSFKLSPAPVDTANGAVRVTAEITGSDVEGITGAGLYINGYAGYPDNPTRINPVDIAWVETFQLVSGTARNGVWRATFSVPGGTPNGAYFIQAVLQDSSHFQSWVSSDCGWTTDNHVLTPELALTGDHFIVANS